MGRGIALACTAKDAPGNAFHVGAGKNYGPADFLRALHRLLPGRAVELAPGAGKKTARPRVDLSTSERVLGYKPQYSLEKGIAGLHGGGAASRLLALRP